MPVAVGYAVRSSTADRGQRRRSGALGKLLCEIGLCCGHAFGWLFATKLRWR